MEHSHLSSWSVGFLECRHTTRGISRLKLLLFRALKFPRPNSLSSPIPQNDFFFDPQSNTLSIDLIPKPHASEVSGYLPPAGLFLWHAPCFPIPRASLQRHWRAGAVGH